MSTKMKGWPRETIEQGAGRDLDSYERSLIVTPPKKATIKRAQLYVASQSHDAADARELLDALGLLP